MEDKGDESAQKFAASRKPLLGVCRGMELLVSISMDFGQHRGLGIIPGRVEAIPRTSTAGPTHKVPHSGWTGITVPRGISGWASTILSNVAPGDAVYLVHSFAMQPSSEAHRLADCDYNGRTITAAIQKDNVCGTQFHPEKSGAVGLAIVRGLLAA